MRWKLRELLTHGIHWRRWWILEENIATIDMPVFFRDRWSSSLRLGHNLVLLQMKTQLTNNSFVALTCNMRLAIAMVTPLRVSRTFVDSCGHSSRLTGLWSLHGWRAMISKGHRLRKYHSRVKERKVRWFISDMKISFNRWMWSIRAYRDSILFSKDIHRESCSVLLSLIVTKMRRKKNSIFQVKFIIIKLTYARRLSNLSKYLTWKKRWKQILVIFVAFDTSLLDQSLGVLAREWPCEP